MILLFFDYGQRTLKQERKASKKCAKELNADFLEVKLDFLRKISDSLINKKKKPNKITRKDLKNSEKESKNWYVPCRNTVFLVHALAFAESLCFRNKEKYDIFVGFKNEGEESYPDTTKEFVKEINKLSKISCSSYFKVLAPIINKDKEDIIKTGRKLGVKFKDTFTCYVGSGKKHCGSCLSCRLRQEGFYWANIKDPTKYKTKMKDFRVAKS